MRRRGSSYREIREVLGIPKSTLSGWFRQLLLTEEEKEKLASNVIFNREKATSKNLDRHALARQHIIEEAFAEITQLTEEELFIAGVVAYWAEGTKAKPWRQAEQVSFMNSDPKMIQLFLAWLELIGVSNEELAFRLSIHESADLGEALEFWSRIVAVSPEGFDTPSIKKHNPNTVRKNVGDAYRGCLIVRVRRSTRLNRRIEGWFRGIIGEVSRSRWAEKC